MALSLSPSPKLQFFANNGQPLAGGYLYTSAAGTPSNPKTSYADAAGTPNTNPVLLDSAGRCSLWLDGYYYLELWTGDKTLPGSTLLWTQDNVSPTLGVSPPAPTGVITVQRFSGDNVTTVFVLSTPVDTANAVWVFVEGVYQQKNTYTASGTTLTFTSSPPLGTDNVEVLIGTLATAFASPQDSGTAAPTTGSYPAGWIRWNSAPVSGQNIGWVCVAAGTPGTWFAFGQISL